MTKRNDEVAATDALLAWLASQEISPTAAVPILARAIISIVYALERAGGNDPEHCRDGLRIAADMILKAKVLPKDFKP